MKKQSKARPNGSAAAVKPQSQSTAAKKPTYPVVKVMFPESVVSLIERAAKERGESRDEFIRDAVRAKVEAVQDNMAAREAGDRNNPPASLAAAVPANMRQASIEELQAANRNRMNLPLAPQLDLWAGQEISDTDALVYMAEAICEHEPAWLDYAKHLEAPCKAPFLAELSVAKGIIAGLKQGSILSRVQAGEMFFPSLPGLLGRKRVRVRQVLESIAWFLTDVQNVIEKKIIPSLADRAKALTLAESLVLAQAELYRDGQDKEDIESSLELANRLLVEALQARAA
jgi:hypothetical protein